MKNSKSIRENPKEPEKMSTHKLPEIFMNKQTDFSMNYFTNMDTQIESVKHTSIPLMEENYKEKAKKISNEMQISIESNIFLIK